MRNTCNQHNNTLFRYVFCPVCDFFFNIRRSIGFVQKCTVYRDVSKFCIPDERNTISVCICSDKCSCTISARIYDAVHRCDNAKHEYCIRRVRNNICDRISFIYFFTVTKQFGNFKVYEFVYIHQSDRSNCKVLQHQLFCHTCEPVFIVNYFRNNIHALVCNFFNYRCRQEIS